MNPKGFQDRELTGLGSSLWVWGGFWKVPGTPDVRRHMRVGLGDHVWSSVGREEGVPSCAGQGSAVPVRPQGSYSQAVLSGRPRCRQALRGVHGKLACFPQAAGSRSRRRGGCKALGTLACFPLSPIHGHQSKNHTGLPLLTEEAGMGCAGEEQLSQAGEEGATLTRRGWEGWSLPWKTHAWVGRT